MRGCELSCRDRREGQAATAARVRRVERGAQESRTAPAVQDSDQCQSGSAGRRAVRVPNDRRDGGFFAMMKKGAPVGAPGEIHQSF